MNSHAAAINLQSSGQSVVVVGGHHRGFSQPSTTTTSSTNSATADPWFLQSSAVPSAAAAFHPNPMPPTAPLRQHKRPAPQPNGMVLQSHPQQQPHSLNSLSNPQLHLLQQQQQQPQMSFAPPLPPLQSQKPIPVQHHPHSSQSVSFWETRCDLDFLIAPSLVIPQNHNALHTSSHALNQPQSQQPMPISLKAPKSPILGQQRHLMQTSINGTAGNSGAANLMSTSLTSGQVLGANNLSDGLMLNLHSSTTNQMPLLMSTSLNSGGGGDQNNGSGSGAWNSTSSLSPTSIATQQHLSQLRKSEVKLNAMP